MLLSRANLSMEKIWFSS